MSNLRTVLALDSNNLQAFSTLAFIYYDMNMLEMAKLVGNQAIKKAEEIATGKFEEEKVEEANEKAAVKAGKGKAKKEKGEKKGDEEGGRQAEGDRARGRHRRHRRHEEAAGGRPQHAGPRRAEEEEHQPRDQAVQRGGRPEPELRRGAHEPRGAVAEQPRLQLTAEENFKAVIKLQPKNFEAAIGLGVALRGNKKIDEAEAQYNAAKGLDPSQGGSYFNLGLLYQEYKDGQKPSLQKAQDYYRQFLGHASGGTSDSLKKEAEKRIKDIDEIYVALEEAAKMQAESEAMQKKAEEQQKQMEEQMKKQEEEEKKKAEADKAAAEAKKAGGDKGAAAAAGGDTAKGAAAGCGRRCRQGRRGRGRRQRRDRRPAGWQKGRQEEEVRIEPPKL